MSAEIFGYVRLIPDMVLVPSGFPRAIDLSFFDEQWRRAPTANSVGCPLRPKSLITAGAAHGFRLGSPEPGADGRVNRFRCSHPGRDRHWKRAYCRVSPRGKPAEIRSIRKN